MKKIANKMEANGMTSEFPLRKEAVPAANRDARIAFKNAVPHSWRVGFPILISFKVFCHGQHDLS